MVQWPIREPTPMSAIYYLGTEHHHGDTRYAVAFAINGARWRYLLTPMQSNSVDYLARRVSIGKALAYAKRHTSHSEKLA